MGTDIITPKRNKLSDRRIEILSFLKINLDSEFKIWYQFYTALKEWDWLTLNEIDFEYSTIKFLF